MGGNCGIWIWGWNDTIRRFIYTVVIGGRGRAGCVCVLCTYSVATTRELAVEVIRVHSRSQLGICNLIMPRAQMGIVLLFIVARVLSK